jgi:chromosome segregation ATPase
MIEPPEDLKGASQHVWITCPHCQRSNLRIQRANIGRKVYCKHCGQGFRAVLSYDPGAIATPTRLAPREARASAPAAADQPRGAMGQGELQRIRAERDQLRAELRAREADRLRLTERVDELEALRADRDRLDAAVGARVAREEQLQARIHEVERRAGEERDQAEDQRRVWQERLDATRLQLERDLPPLREEAERLRHQVETLVRERDVALRQIEALDSDRDRLAVLLERVEAAGREAARHEAEAHRLARTIEQDRDQLAVMVRRNEELAEQAQGLGTKLDRLHRDREDEGREHRRSLESLRHDLEIARAGATAASDRAAAAGATRAELEGRLAEFEDRLRAANERAQRLEGEMQAQRDWVAVPQSESELGRSLADDGREADRLRIEQLTADLDEARAANERLRSLLNVFGLVDHLGSGAGLPPSV